MKKIFTVLAGLLGWISADCQFATPSGGTNGAVLALKTLGDSLYVSGDFTTAFGLETNGLGGLSPSPCSLAGFSSGYATNFIRFENASYAIGNFPEQFAVKDIHNKWVSAASLNGVPQAMIVWNNQLVVGGTFTLVNNEPSPGIFFLKDGLVTFPDISSTLAVKCLGLLNNQLKIVADNPEYQSDEMYTFDGNQLTIDTLPNFGIRTVAFDATHLYVAGTAVGTPSSGLAIATGNSWEYLDMPFGMIFSMKSTDSDLYIVGTFGFIDGVSVHNICRYSGGQIIPIDNDLGNEDVVCVEKFQGDLYIGGYMASMNYIAKLDLNVGIETSAPKKLLAFPNPTSGQLYIPSGEVSIINSVGQLIAVKQSINGTLDLSSLTPGIYRVGTKESYSTIVKE